MGRNVLICDDDKLLTSLLELKFGAHDFLVTVANDGREALEMIKASKPDIIILDAMMPFLNGYDLLRIIREKSDHDSIPVIILSARKQEEDIVNALNIGANDYVIKPFIPGELIARAERLLNKSSLA